MRTAFVAGLGGNSAFRDWDFFCDPERLFFWSCGVPISGPGGRGGHHLGLHLLASAFSWAFVLAGLFALAFLSRSRRTSADSWVATLYVLGAALAVLVLSKSARGETEALGVFFGNILNPGKCGGVGGLGALFDHSCRVSGMVSPLGVVGLRSGRGSSVRGAGGGVERDLPSLLCGRAHALYPYLWRFAVFRLSHSAGHGGSPGCAADLEPCVLARFPRRWSRRWDLSCRSGGTSPRGLSCTALLALLAIGARLYAGRRGEG